MNVEPIKERVNNSTILVPSVKGVLLGGIAGCVSKYILPLTTEEKNSDEYVKISNRIKASTAQYNFQTEKYLLPFKLKYPKSEANIAFLKLFKGLKEGERVHPNRLRRVMKTLSQNNPSQVEEFKKLCKALIQESHKRATLGLNLYEFSLKHLRPNGLFATIGAFIGGGVTLAYKVLKTYTNKN